jgi:DNA-directed RNA polymerase subunit RPC12/RpoP
MSHYISVPCPNCGHPCEISSDQKSGICPCCGSKVLIAEEHVQNIQVKNENTIVVNDGEEDFIKRGNGFAKLGDWKLLFDCGKKMYERFPTSPWPYLFQAEAKSSLDFANLPKVSMAISDEEKKEYFEKASAAYLSSAPKGAAAYKGQLSNDDIDFLEEKTTLSFKKATEAHPKKTTQIESRLESLKEDSEKSAIVDTFASKIALFQNDRSSLFYGYYLTWSKQVKACQANLIRFEDEVKEYIRQNAAKCTSLIRASVLESLPEASIAPYYIQRAKEEKAKIREASVPNNSGKLIKEAQAATKYKEETSKVWHQFRSLFIESIFLIFFLIWPSLVAILQEDAVYRAAFVFATFIFSGIVFIFVEHSIKKAGFDDGAQSPWRVSGLWLRIRLAARSGVYDSLNRPQLRGTSLLGFCFDDLDRLRYSFGVLSADVHPGLLQKT